MHGAWVSLKGHKCECGKGCRQGRRRIFGGEGKVPFLALCHRITFHAYYFSQPKSRAMTITLRIRLREVSGWPKTLPPLWSVVGELHPSLFSLLREGLPSLYSSIASVMSLVMALTGTGLKAAGNRDQHLQDL